MTIDQDSFKVGYQSAARFYGPNARFALAAIAEQLAAFRRTFPTLPGPVEPFIAHLEQLAHQDDHDNPPA